MTEFDPQPEQAIEAILQEQEMALLDPAVRRDAVKVRELLDKGFQEFGSSGRVWDLSAILNLMADEKEWEAPAVEDFAVERVDENVALVTYRAVRRERTTLRSSLWVIREGRWRMYFHQGTIVAKAES